MATIGYLRIVTEATTDKLSKGLNQAATMVSGFGSSAMGAVGSIAKIGGVATAVANTGLALFIKSGADAINTTRVLAERLGTSVEGLSKLQYAAQIADVDAESLGKNLEKMTERLGEVAMTGQGKAADALKRFGLSAADLAKGDAIDSFHVIVDTLGKIQNPAECAATAIDVFGKSGASMLNFVVQGAKGLAGMEAEADLLGVTISDIDAAKIDEADDSMTRVWETLGGLAKRLAVEVAPFITAATEKLVDFAKTGVDGGDAVSQSMGWVVSGVGGVGDALQVCNAGWLAFKSAALFAVSAVLEGVGWLADKLNEFSEWLGKGKLFDTGAIHEWGSAAKDASVEAYNAMEKVWSKPWAHDAIKQAAADIQLGAEARAIGAVDQASRYKGSGSLDHAGKGKDKAEAMKFAGAYDVGSKEAYSAALQARGMGKNDKAVQATATNTARTAAAAEKTATSIDALADALSMGLASGQDLIDFLQAGA